jgi:ATP-dependent DNA ligase
VTYDLAQAQEWFDVLPAAMGVEGLVLKPTAARYAGGRRSSWAKVNSVGVVGVRSSTDRQFDLVRQSWARTGLWPTPVVHKSSARSLN